MAVYAQVIQQPGPGEWAELEKAAGDPGTLANHQEKHRQGQAVVAQIQGEAQGMVMLWRERISRQDSEIVCALGTGRNARTFIPWLIEMANANGATSIRTHCKRPGLIRLYERAGFKKRGLDEQGFTIMRRENGRR